jgi:hypothetical protein
MFRVKTTRRATKRNPSPVRPENETADIKPINKIVLDSRTEATSDSLEKQMVHFFEAESAATCLSKPWLRLERGIRLQKYRAFAEAYPGLNLEEKEALYKVLMKANDAKLLNTKQHIQYENGIIQSVRGLKVLRGENGATTFKIDAIRSTKKNLED